MNKQYPAHQVVNDRTLYREVEKPSEEEIKDALVVSDYKYFGFYEMDETQFKAMETLVQLALHYLKDNEENK